MTTERFAERFSTLMHLGKGGERLPVVARAWTRRSARIRAGSGTASRSRDVHGRPNDALTLPAAILIETELANSRSGSAAAGEGAQWQSAATRGRTRPASTKGQSDPPGGSLGARGSAHKRIMGFRSDALK
jgi:hypothetical protein